MADKKITALTATSSVVDADIFPIVVDIAGTPTTKKVTALDLGTYLGALSAFDVTSLDDVADVTAPSPTTGDVLKWNGTAWVNSTVDFSSAQSVLAGAVFNS